jgi:predicted MFS family arabinose efflux permease
VMLAPVRVIQTLRPNIPAGVFAATAVSTVVFASTPFLIPAIADDRALSVGLVGIISTAQLGGFVISSSIGPRFLRPRRRVMVLAIVIGVVANLLSATSPWFAMLVATRMLSGLSLGLIAWIAWAEVFGDNERVGDVAIIGPIIGTIASPIVALVVDRAGPDWLFAVLALLYFVPAVFVRSMRLDAAKRPHRDRHRPTRAAAAILVVLTMLTLGGSATFVFAGAIGHDVIGLPAFTVSLVFAANALAGLPSARFRGDRKLPGLWLCLTGLSAVAVGTLHYAAVFWIALIVWGFAFWMGIPGAFSLLAERSKYPDERAGDAQAVMALGRVVGPLLGGVLYEISPAALGIGGGGVIIVAALLLVWVEWRIRPTLLTDVRGA